MPRGAVRAEDKTSLPQIGNARQNPVRSDPRVSQSRVAILPGANQPTLQSGLLRAFHIRPEVVPHHGDGAGLRPDPCCPARPHRKPGSAFRRLWPSCRLRTPGQPRTDRRPASAFPPSSSTGPGTVRSAPRPPSGTRRPPGASAYDQSSPRSPTSTASGIPAATRPEVPPPKRQVGEVRKRGLRQEGRHPLIPGGPGDIRAGNGSGKQFRR